MQVEFSTTTYNALLDVCARSGQIARAEPLLKQMADQGLSPSVITYSTVIKAYCASNQLEQAFKLFEAGVFNGKITKVQSGYSWFQEMKRHTDLDPDEVTFNTLLDGCARYGLYDRGCEVLTVACPGCVAEGQAVDLFPGAPITITHHYDVCSSVLSGISSDILSGIPSGALSGIFSGG